MTDPQNLEALRRRKRHRLANSVIRRNVIWSMGTGMIPVPVVDTSATLAVQIKMVSELSEIYGIPFRRSAASSAVAALLASLTGNMFGKSLIGTGLFSTVARSMPVVGHTLTMLTMPAFNGAATYALGKVFQQHFAAGGTFLTFDPKQTDAYFREKFAEGRDMVKNLHKKTDEKSTA